MITPIVPPLLVLPGQSDYQAHYRATFIGQSHFTHDHIRVKFHPETFSHAFFESTDRRNPSKDQFSVTRAERMPWILHALGDSQAQMLAGWLSAERCYSHDRRVTLLSGRYAVVLRLEKTPNTASFVTAYPLDPPSQGKISESPLWDRAQCRWGP